MAAAGLCCSIEMEPRTLSEGQINQAREIAGSIAKRFEPSEVEIIFTEGLKSISSTREPLMPEIKESDPREVITENGILAIPSCSENEKAPMLEKPCQCSLLIPPLDESPIIQDQTVPREPYTAPF